MSDESREWDPIERARWSTEFFGPRVPGRLGCAFDHSAKDLVVCRCVPVHLGRQTHVWDATVTNETNGRTMALFSCTQMVLVSK